MRLAKFRHEANGPGSRPTRDLVLAATPWLMTAIVALLALA
jgi:hypothetical protein